MNAPLTLENLLPVWLNAKEAERKAIEHRRELDRMIQDLMPKKDEGSISQNFGDYKVSVTYKLDRKIDTDRLRDEWGQLPPEVWDAVKWSASLSMSEYRNRPAAELALSPYITTKPASPSVTVELVAKDK